MEVFTRKGDKGNTKDYSGKKLAKDSERIIVWGEMDELQSIIDLAILKSRGEHKKILENIQKKLWQASAEIARCDKECLIDPVTEKDVELLENTINSLGNYPKKFVRMNTEKAIIFNECRVRCRRLERSMVSLLKKKQLRPVMYHYINRLSSLFFMLAYKSSK